MKRRYGASRFLLHRHYYNMQADIANNPQTLDDGNVRMEKNGTYCTSELYVASWLLLKGLELRTPQEGGEGQGIESRLGASHGVSHSAA
jgi:hypothetical protein